MLEIGETHPIPAVRGMRPSVLPDFESSTLSSTDDMLGPENSVGRGSVRLREIEAKCMIEATAQIIMAIADKTQARRDGR